MKIGIIGSGNVGGTLGNAWSRLGHEVFFGFRKAGDQGTTLPADAAATAKAGLVHEAVKVSEVILLATPWDAAQEALLGAGDLAGKILIDATNPLLPGLAGMSIRTSSSGGEMVAQWAKGARVVKAFNTVGFNIMADANFKQGQVAMFYCGGDGHAKKIVAGLAEQLGFEALDAGPLTQCRLLESFALLWISLAVKQGYGREIGFQFMRRDSAAKYGKGEGAS